MNEWMKMKQLSECNLMGKKVLTNFCNSALAKKNYIIFTRLAF